MKTPLSIPTSQPQPNTAIYSMDALNRLDTYDSPAVYEAFFGEAPDPYDKTLPLKLWKDDTQDNVPDNFIAEYTVLKTVLDTQTGVDQLVLPPTFVSYTMPASLARKVNIWGGALVYPTWSPTTTATIDDNNGFVSPVNVNLLSELADAQTLNTLLGGSGVQEYIMAPGNSGDHINYHDDTKRQYYFIDSNGQFQWAGVLLDQQYAKTETQNVISGGVGAPGSWINQVISTMPALSAWIWKSTPLPVGPPPNTAVIPMPVRRLYDNESFTEPFAGQPMIQRTFTKPKVK
jgi:hypothetical protein